MESPKEFAAAFLKGDDGGGAPAPKTKGGSPALLAAAKALGSALGIEIKDPGKVAEALSDFMDVSGMEPPADGDEPAAPAADDDEEPDLASFAR